MAKTRHFQITRGKGFRFGFPSGYALSVQFGPGNYSDNYDAEIGADEIESGKRGSNTAEIAIITPEGDLLGLPHGDSVDGHCSPDKVLAYLNAAASGDPLKFLSENPVAEPAA